MRVIGARQGYKPKQDYRVKSSDDSTVLTFCRDGEKVQVDINGDWLWLGPYDVRQLQRWLKKGGKAA